MTLTIELTPQQQTWLDIEARRQGLQPAELVTRFVIEHLPALNAENGQTYPKADVSDKDHFYFTATPDEFNRALDEIAEMNRGLPVLPEEAFDRENLYEECI